LDACVLIDFIKADRTVLASIHKHVGKIHVVSPVVTEILDIDNPSELTELGIIIIEPEIEDAFTAATGNGATSFQDRLCLLTAKRNYFTCVTNDISLRSLCVANDVPILWGLQTLTALHKLRGISTQDALRIATLIHKSNPKHITDKILKKFTEIINSQDSG
jgi:hypothetical protein